MSEGHAKDPSKRTTGPRSKQRRRGRLAFSTILAGLLLGIGIQVGILFFARGAPGLAEPASPMNLWDQQPVATASSESFDLLEQPLLDAPEVPTPEREAYAFQVTNWSPVPSPDDPKRPANLKPQNEAEKTRQASPESINVLVLGVDRSPSSIDTGTRSDAIMVVQVEPSTGRIDLLSIPRDLLCEIAPGWQDRINAAYAYYGVAGAKEAVENLTEIRIDNYAVVDFEGFRGVVDAMGGVRVKVEDEFPPQRNIDKGVQRLDGREALFYARYRGTSGGDLDRVERQQRLVAALRSQALDWSTLTKLPEMASVMNENIETDMSVREAVSLGRILVQRQRNARMTAVSLKGSTVTMANGNQVLAPDQKANEVVLESFR